jgi:hypothetical protein
MAGLGQPRNDTMLETAAERIGSAESRSHASTPANSGTVAKVIPPSDKPSVKLPLS